MARKNRMPEHRMRNMKQSVPKSVDEYIAAQPEAVRPKLEQVCSAITRAVPEAVEGIGYRMPGYKMHGKPMLYFAGIIRLTPLPATENVARSVRVRPARNGWPNGKPSCCR